MTYKVPIIGTSAPRIDARDKVTGAARFPDDTFSGDHLVMKCLFAGRASGIVRQVETSHAEALPGVVAVITARDVPNNLFGWISPDQPLLCGPGSTNPEGDIIHFEGDMLALVVAESEALAQEALGRIAVECDPRPSLLSIDDALATGAPLVHPDRTSNLICHYQIRKGDVEAAFRQADVIIEETYHTPVQEHAYLQPEAALAQIDEAGRVMVTCAGQWAHDEQRHVSHVLGLPVDQVRIVHAAIGGGFGGRNVVVVMAAAALAAWRLQQRGILRPVRFCWDREETTAYTQKRHPYRVWAKWGATREGKLLAAEMKLLADGGAYTHTTPMVTANTHLTCSGPYEIPNIRVDTDAVYTNTAPKCAFRGFGSPQGAFVAEGQMSRLARVLGMDEFELRLRNAWRADSLMSTNSPPPSGVSIAPVLAACARAAGWQETASGWIAGDRPQENEPASPLRRGIGVACGYKNVGDGSGFEEYCSAVIELRGGAVIEQALLRIAGVEIGQGAHTVFTQMAADALGIGMQQVRLAGDDTAHAPDFGPTAASRSTFMGGNAIRGAAEQALIKWRIEERPAVGSFTFKAPPTTPFDPQTGESVPNFCYGYVAQVVEVEVDTETGLVRLLKVISAHDVGKAINPQTLQGQVEGGVVMGAGYAILEDFIQQNGKALTRDYATYLIPTVLDAPMSVETVLLEHADPLGPHGARGVGEMPLIPVAAAVAAAVRDATGAWFNRFPFTPERVLQGIGVLDSLV